MTTEISQISTCSFNIPYQFRILKYPAVLGKSIPPILNAIKVIGGASPSIMSSSTAAPGMAHHTATAASTQPRHPLPLQSAWERHHVATAETAMVQQQQQHNSSIRHPVFFTEKLRRPPLTLAPGMGLSPVAHGYVYQDGRRRTAAEGNSAPKL
ncbi:hypothetical protein CaCOL14_007477 [Colletotrichum acutatum]